MRPHAAELAHSAAAIEKDRPTARRHVPAFRRPAAGRFRRARKLRARIVAAKPEPQPLRIQAVSGRQAQISGDLVLPER